MIGKRRVGARAIDVVALDAFVELAEAGAENGFTGTEDIPGKSDARLKREVIVLHDATREVILPGQLDAIQVERSSVVVGESRAGSRAARRGSSADCAGVVEDRGSGRVVIAGNKVSDLVVL